MDIDCRVARENARLVDNRRHPRFPLRVEIRIYPRNCQVVRGQTVDISESGISAMLREEAPLGQLVRLEFELPDGPVEVHAMVRQKNAFRYGFEFLQSAAALPVIARTCRQLAIEASLCEDAPAHAND